MSERFNFKNYYLKNGFILELVIILLLLVGIVLKINGIELGNSILIASLVLLCLIYLCNITLRSPKSTRDGPKAVRYRAFMFKLIYLALTIELLAVLVLESLGTIETAMSLLFAGIGTLVVIIPFAVFIELKYPNHKEIAPLDYIRILFASGTIIVIYLNNTILPFFNDLSNI